MRSGNCLQLNDGRLGLIDYGQTRRIGNVQRKAFARVVVELNESRKHEHEGRFLHGGAATCFNTSAIASAMRGAGFAVRDTADDETMTQYARLLFDSDEESERQGYTIPQVRLV
jgi:aarF domain-containing kinase